MRILLINYEYPPVGGGGGEVSRFHAEGFASRGHDVKVLTVKWDNLPSRETVRPGLEIHRIRAFRKSANRCTPPRMAAFTILGTIAAARICRRWRPDIIHCHFAVPVAPVGYFLNILFDVPFFVTLHGGDVPGHQPKDTAAYFRIIAPPVKHILKKAALCIAVSEHLGERAIKGYGLENVQVIHNGVNLEMFYPRKSERNWRETRFVFAGRFSRVKRLQVLVEAVKILSEEHPEKFSVTLIGGGPEENNLRKAISENKLGTYIEFAGWKSRAVLADILRRSDVFVLPSEMEGMPMSCLQAMSTGLPIAGTRIRGILEVVKEEQTALLAEPGDAKSLAGIMSRFISTPALIEKLGARGREIVLTHYRWESVITKYLERMGSIL